MWSEQKKEWFCRQVELCRDSMYAVARGMLRSDADAQDAISEAVLQAYRNLPLLRSPEAFRAWLLKILTRVCYRMAREREPSVELEEVSGQLAGPERDVDRSLTLYAAVQALPLEYRTVVLLYYYEQMEIRTIARTLDLSLDTVKKRLSRARARLREMLDPQEVMT